MVNIFKDKKFLKECGIIFLVGLIVNASCFFMGSIYSKAANLPSGSLPYNVTDYKDLNPILTDSVISAIYSSSDFQSYIGTLDNYILYVSDVSNSSGRANIYVQIIGNPYTDRIYDSNYDYLTQRVWYYGSSWSGINIYLSSDGSIYRVQWRGTNTNLTSFELLGVPGTQTNSNVGLEYTPRYPFAIKETIYDVTGSNYVFVNAIQIVPGEFTDLPGLEEILNNISNSYTPHSNNTPPSYDSSLSDGENITNSIDSLADNLNDAINNLGNNIKSWFDNLQEKLTDTTNAILGGIHDGFATLNENFKDFFGPKLDYIIEKFDYITQSLDSTTIFDGLENEDFYSDFSDLKNFESQVSQLFDISEPTDFSLIIHLENINDDFISLSGAQEIDISFLHNSTLFRSFCWVVVCSGLTFIVASGIPSMLRGDKGD